jgi:hypothetical protein
MIFETLYIIDISNPTHLTLQVLWSDIHAFFFLLLQQVVGPVGAGPPKLRMAQSLTDRTA